MSVVAIIPARGGSKGVKDKNLQKIGGVSLIGRAVRSAKLAQNINKVFVSTDSIEISKEAEKFGAETIFRPTAISGDEASSELALHHALSVIERVKSVVFIQCTSPFIQSTDLEQAVDLVNNKVFDSVFSAVEDHGFRWELQGDSLMPIGHSMKLRPRRQDLPSRFLETGAFYAFSSDGFLESNSRFHGRVGHVLVDKFFQIDIDDYEDLKQAQKISQSFFDEFSSRTIRAVVLDFDGVQTDDYLWIDQEGREFVRVSRSDGLGISMLKKAGFEVIILSTETNPVVGARARKLGIDVLQGEKDKEKAIQNWSKSRELSLTEVAFLGNDLNDLGAMNAVGLPISVADAHPKVISRASLVLKSKGGEKAIRELADIFLNRN